MIIYDWPHAGHSADHLEALRHGREGCVGPLNETRATQDYRSGSAQTCPSSEPAISVLMRDRGMAPGRKRKNSCGTRQVRRSDHWFWQRDRYVSIMETNTVNRSGDRGDGTISIDYGDGMAAAPDRIRRVNSNQHCPVLC